MGDLTDERPKCLVEIKGQPLLDWQLAALRGAGVTEIGVVTGYRRELLASRGLVEFHNPRWRETQMVTSLECASDWLEAGPCIVSYSDIFYSAEAVSSLLTAAASIAITYDPNWLDLWRSRFDDPLSDAETFRLSPDGCLAEIGQRPSSLDEVEGQYMGLLHFTQSGWAEICRVRSSMPPLERDRLHMTGTLQRVLEGGRVRVQAIPYRGTWGEVDSASDLAAAQDNTRITPASVEG
jgi:choline kinase